MSQLLPIGLSVVTTQPIHPQQEGDGMCHQIPFVFEAQVWHHCEKQNGGRQGQATWIHPKRRGHVPHHVPQVGPPNHCYRCERGPRCCNMQHPKCFYTNLTYRWKGQVGNVIAGTTGHLVGWPHTRSLWALPQERQAQPSGTLCAHPECNVWHHESDITILSMFCGWYSWHQFWA